MRSQQDGLFSQGAVRSGAEAVAGWVATVPSVRWPGNQARSRPAPPAQPRSRRAIVCAARAA